MRVLLDTHIFYWSLYNPRRLPERAHKTILDADAVFVSAATIWEMAIKLRLGKMKGDPARLADYIAQSGFTELPIWSRHAKLVATLPLHHTDPFDRLLIAQSMTEPLHLLTSDTKLKSYSDLVICV
jgi:PIN domain nuclease of toxin-antitoxin system